MSLSPDNFGEFFSAVHSDEKEKRQAFPWQLRLAQQVAEGGWPNDPLSLPTSSGKTSVIDIAVFTLALQAERPRFERTAPLRIFFIVDRRIVVDEVTAHARLLARKLHQALKQENSDEVLREVAMRLARLGGDMRKRISGDAPLHVAALRGGLYRDDMWTRTPHVPTVCVSTVDQIGSRLLFRGYALRKEQWPIHAGLVGSDALLIVDEAHLSNPFVGSLESIARYQLQAGRMFGNNASAQRPLTHPWSFVLMSATPRPSQSSFVLTKDDYQNDILRERLQAKKESELVEVAENNFETEVVNHSLKLAKLEGVEVIGVVVNRVASARSIFERLGGSRAKNSGSQEQEAILLTGRVRPFDRDRILSDFLSKIRAGRERGQSARKLFVVATQTVEVGANLDFDALVTEAASLSALRQRFGRLDRLGKLKRTQAVIALRKVKDKDDFIYGKDLTETWAWLNTHAREENGKQTIDFGVEAMQTLFEKSPPPSPSLEQAPTVFPSHLDSWVQTNPQPHADPDPAPFLHGKDALEAADVQIIWRADLNEADLEDWVTIVALCPPLTREALPIPINAARDWLTNQMPVVEVADVEGKSDAGEEKGPFRPTLRWAGPDKSELLEKAVQIRPGDTLIVPATYGGADEFGWNPQAKSEVPDIADLCANEISLSTPARIRGRRKLRLRLQKEALLNLANTIEKDVKAAESLRQAFSNFFKPDDESDTDVEVDLNEWMHKLLSMIKKHLGTNRLIATATTELLSKHDPKPLTYPHADGKRPSGFVLTVAPNEKLEQFDDLSEALIETGGDYTNSDDTASLTEVNVKLHRHCLGVGEWAREFAERCGLPEELVRDLEIAGQWHDFGKADQRMQLWLYGGKEMVAAKNGCELIAKSKEMSANDKKAMDKAREESGYPKGARHEFVSVALMDNAGRPIEGVHDVELVRHLVGTHHGHARPFAQVVFDEGIEVSLDDHKGLPLTANSNHGLDRLDSGWVEQFWRLVRRYGFWGLAYLEALLRLADYARSSQEQNDIK